MTRIWLVVEEHPPVLFTVFEQVLIEFSLLNVNRNLEIRVTRSIIDVAETESSYGGGIGLENDSPILLMWQQKPAGLVDTTPGGGSCSTLENSKYLIEQ